MDINTDGNGIKSVINSVTANNIRNRLCISCGGTFHKPRAGKLYCSPKCKQFYYYHKEDFKFKESEYLTLNASIKRIKFSEFEEYRKLKRNISKYKHEKWKIERAHEKLEQYTKSELNVLSALIPDNLKTLDLPDLSIETWSFLKVLFPKFKKDSFYQLTASLSKSFFDKLQYDEFGSKNEILSPVTKQFLIHLNNIATGKIEFY